MGAYKQLLTSDIIVTPLQVNKGFTFKGSAELTSSNVGIDRFLGQNITQFNFDPNLDPYTGNYTVITPGTTSSVLLNYTNIHNLASNVGSSSFSVNNTVFIITGSNKPLNGFNTIYISSGSTSNNTATSIVNNINNSSSFFSGIYNISASTALAGTITLHSKTTGYINNFNYLISGSTIYFSGGTNDIVSGSYQYQRLVYDSIKQLYYSNYSTSSYGDPVNRQVLIPGRDSEGDRYIGSASSQGHYDNYLQTTLSYPRFFPTASNSYIGVLSIPAGVFGDFIEPYSFRMSFDSSSFYDDGEGNILTGSNIVGNIIYTHGIVTLTGNQALFLAMSNASSPPNVFSSLYGSAIYGTNYIYGTANIPVDVNNTIFGFVNATNFTCSFSSSYTIYETQYKCTIRENEFNFTLNPSTISGSYDTGSTAGSVYGYITESYFSPYVTTIGLYDEQQNLLAIGKLAQPLPSSPTTDTTILINIDR
jgi:hypothetical protein